MNQELPAGTIIGKDYRVIEVLGKGGFGITYKCEDVRLKLIVAVKEYFPEGMAEREPNSLSILPKEGAADIFAWGLKKFLAEGTTLAAIQHKYSNEFIVKILRFVEERDTAYLAMEFIDGMQIDDFALSNRITSASQVEKLFRSLCIKALKPIHDSNFYHRDIKPANILVRHSNGEPVIIDFGAARQAASGKSTVALLTPRYSAVEQYASQEDMEGDGGHDLCGSFTDIYSLAATFYFIIKGEPPQDAPSRILSENTDSLFGDSSLSHYSSDFLKQIDWGMKPVPKDRPQTIEQWLHQVEAAPKSGSSKPGSIKGGGKGKQLKGNKASSVESNKSKSSKMTVIAASIMFVFFGLIFLGSDKASKNTVAAVPKAKPKAYVPIKPSLYATVPPKKTSWVVGVDAVEWTSIEVLEKLEAMQIDLKGEFQLKLHAQEPFRVKTQKGLAITKANARNFGSVNGEVFLKSVNGSPQKVRVEIIPVD